MAKDLMDMSIEELTDHRGLLEAYMQRAIRLARADGQTWDTIGARLGVSRQEAHRRWAWMERTNRELPPDDARI